MRRLACVIGLLLALAGLPAAQQAVPTHFAWDLDASHRWSYDGEDGAIVHVEAAWELEVDGTIVPCEDLQVLSDMRRCTARIDRAAPRTVRLRGVFAACDADGDDGPAPRIEPCPGAWSAPLVVPVGPAPGPFTITSARTSGGEGDLTMALERDSSGVVIDSTDGADATSLSIPYQVHAGDDRVLVVRLLYYRSSTKQLSVSYAGDALTQLGAARYAENDAGDYAEMWYLVAPPVGTANLVISTPNGAVTTAAVEAWTGVNQSAPFGPFVGATGDYPSQSPSLTVSAAVDDVVLDVFGGYSGVSNRTLSAGSNQTSDGVYPSPQSATMHFLGVSQRTATGTSVPMSWSLSSPADGYAWWYGGAALKPATGGGGGLSIPVAMHQYRMRRQ